MGFIVRLLLFPLKILKWLIPIAVCSIIVSMLFSTPADGLSEQQRGAISQNCSTIKQSLSQLQRVDAKTRNYLGTTYETLANKFIVPLNLRLVKNNRATLPHIQSDFSLKQSEFRSTYTEYMREMETLIDHDCQKLPDEFYSQLEVVRKKRSDLRKITEELSQLAEEQYASVLDLRQKL